MDKKIKKENDIFTPEEFQTFEEYQSFPSERYISKEAEVQKMESFESEEIKKVSFVEDEENKEEKKNDDSINKIKEKVIKSTPTSTIVSSVTTVAVAVVGASTIGVLPILNKGENFGTFAFKEEVISEMYVTKDEEGNDINYVSSLQVFIDSDIDDEYILNANIVNEDEIITSGILNEENGYIHFKDFFVNKDISELNIEINIYKSSNEKLIKTYSKNVHYVSDYKLETQAFFEYVVTFNSDGTTNVYFNRDISDLNAKYSEELKETVQIVDENNDILINYDISEINNIEENIYCIEDIPYQSYSLLNKVYYTKNSVDYLLRKTEIKDVNSSSISDYYLELDYSNGNIYIFNSFLIYEDAQLELSDGNGNVIHTGVIDNSYAYYKQTLFSELSSEEINVDISYIDINPYESPYSYNHLNEDYIKGEFFKDFDVNITLYKEDIDDYLELRQMRIYPDDRNSYLSCLLLFDYSYPSEYVLCVDVIDNSTDSLYESFETYFPASGMSIYDLDRSLEYTFEYYLKDSNGNEISGTRKSYVTDTVNEYDGLDVTYHNTNPGDIAFTYNSNGTYNLYIITGFVNNTDVDVIYGMDLRSDIDSFEYYTNEPFIAIENLSSCYGPAYNAYVIDENDPIKYYAIKNDYPPSGTTGETVSRIFAETYENYFTFDYEEISGATNEYYIIFDRKIYSDITYEVIFDDDTSTSIKGTIAKEDVMYGLIDGYEEERYYIELDLSSYTWTNNIKINMSAMNGTMTNSEFEYINQNFNVKGTCYWSSAGSSYIYLNTSRIPLPQI